MGDKTSFDFSTNVSKEMVYNLKPVVNAAVNKLDLFTKSGGGYPTLINPIRVMIPDGNGYTQRLRVSNYLSGVGQFVMAEATNYWSKGSLDVEIKTAYIYAIWDGTGIVWALAGYSGFSMVPTTTTVTDDDFFLLEYGSTYTRSNSHYCVCVGRIRYQYDTADNPDHTIQTTVENAPQIMWNPPSDYSITRTLATTLSQASDLTSSGTIIIAIKQTGIYAISGKALCQCTGGTAAVTGSITYEVKTVSYTYEVEGSANLFQVGFEPRIMPLNSGQNVALNLVLTGASGNRIVYGDSSQPSSTYITVQRIG
jgi:hypothetical protein